MVRERQIKNEGEVWIMRIKRERKIKDWYKKERKKERISGRKKE